MWISIPCYYRVLFTFISSILIKFFWEMMIMLPPLYRLTTEFVVTWFTLCHQSQRDSCLELGLLWVDCPTPFHQINFSDVRRDSPLAPQCPWPSEWDRPVYLILKMLLTTVLILDFDVQVIERGKRVCVCPSVSVSLFHTGLLCAVWT